MTTSVPSVCAVVLTYNAPARIKRSMEALTAQSRPVDRAIVVDNHSTDATAAFLQDFEFGSGDRSAPRIEVIRTDENLGPAGGFHVGMKRALATGCDYLWLLDDDSAPAPDCLEQLLTRAADAEADIYWPSNVDETGRDTFYPAWRGELLTRDLVRRGGLPRKEFFWGQEDTEYLQWRLPKEHGARSVSVPAAVVRHDQSNPRKATAWHFYYLTRNTVYYRLFVQRPRKYRKLVSSLSRLWARGVVREEHRLANLAGALRGLVDGLRGRLGKTIDPDTP